ncbi:hypothetical protein [Roseofilum capinflatum]|uniref:Uncharacterized protein n=1 Tax=Roseofilum capinflatum BLCC-M114 TaxID=3022440 RepID=A0ABT7B220_9CYAN|nr:hypothetical protein [Roseofilum capinflatum]MDJ1173207.1 hypothetical protein [Roseofilum capinflatum BLCC-M114]
MIVEVEKKDFLMKTESFQVLQVFGLEYPNYKILVQDKNKNRYIVWYYDRLSINIGQEVLIDFKSDNWLTINNPKNGNKSSISKVSKVN